MRSVVALRVPCLREEVCQACKRLTQEKPRFPGPFRVERIGIEPVSSCLQSAGSAAWLSGKRMVERKTLRSNPVESAPFRVLLARGPRREPASRITADRKRSTMHVGSVPEPRARLCESPPGSPRAGDECQSAWLVTSQSFLRSTLPGDTRRRVVLTVARPSVNPASSDGHFSSLRARPRESLGACVCLCRH
jgi:hypothetical protein